MNDADFTDLLEARLRLTYHDVAVTPPRRRDDVAAGRLRRAVRVPALLATPVLALLSVLVVAGASTVAKTVVTGTANPLDWGPRHVVSAPLTTPGGALPGAVRPPSRGAATEPDDARPTDHPGRGGGAAAGVHQAGGPAGGKGNGQGPGNNRSGPARVGHDEGASGRSS